MVFNHGSAEFYERQPGILLFAIKSISIAAEIVEKTVLASNDKVTSRLSIGYSGHSS